MMGLRRETVGTETATEHAHTHTHTHTPHTPHRVTHTDRQTHTQTHKYVIKKNPKKMMGENTESWSVSSQRHVIGAQQFAPHAQWESRIIIRYLIQRIEEQFFCSMY